MRALSTSSGEPSTIAKAVDRHHLYFIGADIDEAGQILRVIVDLERDPFG